MASADVSSNGSAAGDVRRHVFRQTAAYAALRSISGALTWVAFVLLARILDQRSFGAFEIGMFYIGVGQILGDGGLTASLVRRPGVVQRSEYQTALTSVLALAALLALSLFVAAPFIGRANQLTPSEVWALRALSPLYLVPALRCVPYAKLERRVDFATIGQIELYANLIRHLTAISVAVLKGGVWALVLSQLALAASQAILAYRAEPGFVGLGWSRRTFASLYAYGSKIQATILLIHFKDNLAAGLLGPTLGPAPVGIFRFAMEFIRVPADIVSGVARVQFPVYAQHDRRSPELLGVVRGTLRTAFLLGLPVLGSFALVAPWVVPLVYGPKWLASLPVISALVPHVAADLLAFHLITLVQGRGRAGFALVIYVLWSASQWLGSASALHFIPGSLTAVALAHGVGSGLTVVVLLAWSGRYLGVPLYRALLAPLIAAGVSLAVAAALQSALSDVAWLRVLASSLVFLLGYAACLYALERRTVVRELRAALGMLRS
ncbi:MAG: oligosaccharide flippase family protein [Polyangiaceae bacterium]